jgi:putative membrane protein
MIDWGSWRNQPILLGGLVLLGWLYGLGVGPLRGRLAPGEPFPRRRAIRFSAGLALLYLALGSPLDEIARYFLCSAHTLQDVLVLYPAAALLLLGAPPWLLDPALVRMPRPLGRALLGPLVCGGSFVVTVSGWYVPRLFDGSLRTEGLHALRAFLLLGAGVMFWWPLLSPSRLFPSLRPGARLVYLFAVQVALTGVFTYVLMADHAMYPTYEHAPRLIAALPPGEDQVLAGTLLSFLSSAVLIAALGLNFFRWSQTEQPGSRQS